MIPKVNSLFAAPFHENGEVISTLLSNSQFRLEHIVSFGAASEPGFWYDQQWSEWVVLIRGNASLEFSHGQLELTMGDHLLIPAHLKHRVSHTSADAVWIAIHFPNPKERQSLT